MQIKSRKKNLVSQQKLITESEWWSTSQEIWKINFLKAFPSAE
jgi:hypothetical protein